MKKQFFAFLAALLMSTTGALAANDQELYDPKPPADAAFVRFVNIAAKETEVSGGGLSAKKVAPATASNFFIVKQGKQTFSYSSKSNETMIEAGKYYTVALGEDKVMVVEDAILSNPAKSMLYFYNFSANEALTLFAPKQKTAIFSDIKTGTGTSREINPLALELSVKQGEKDLTTVPALTLKRRMGHSIFVIGDAANPKVIVVENAVSR
jgi:alginate O-acetyltransferase complex protein AlgF